MMHGSRDIRKYKKVNVLVLMLSLQESSGVSFYGNTSRLPTAYRAALRQFAVDSSSANATELIQWRSTSKASVL